jgi:acetyl esterase/lipase
MALTLNPEVAQALAPMAAAMAGSTPPPVGDVASRRMVLEGIIAHAGDAQPRPSDVTQTDYHAKADDGTSILVRWYTKNASAGTEPGPAAVFLHGGGMILGNVDQLGRGAQRAQLLAEHVGGRRG